MTPTIMVLIFSGVLLNLFGLATLVRAELYRREVKSIKDDIEDFRGQLIDIATKRRRRY